MNKSIIALTICGFSLLTGCQNADQAAPRDVYPENGDTINIMERGEHYNQNASLNELGYVRHQKSPLEEGEQMDQAPSINKEQLANSISQLLVTLRHVNDAAALVTDDEILVAYSTDVEDERDRFEVADWVKKTALSMAPRFYHVYISDNETTFEDIERFAQLDTTTVNIDNSIDQTIRRMLESPQGRELNEGENENGESIGEINGEINEDNRAQQMKQS